MLLAVAAIVVGLALLVWSADKFIDGAAISAKYAGLSPLLIGMIVVGFGTSAPEMVVSAMAAMDGKPELALGNAIGSNITNIALILGITAVIAPIAVQSGIVRKELPMLLAISLGFGALLLDGEVSLFDALVLLVGFAVVMVWSVLTSKADEADVLSDEVQGELVAHEMPLKTAVFWLLVGLVVLVLSSRMLVWGAVEIATALGVSELIIGLTIVALGTSLPELASSIVAARKGEHDIALGNIIGSNMFNILAVVGIAGLIAPMAVPSEVFNRDWFVMMALTVALLLMCFAVKGRGRVNRVEGGLLLAAYVGYSVYLAWTVIA